MTLREESEQDDVISEINLTPLIDIMLVLLIIFMVTSSVSLESGLDIDLPQTTAKTAQKQVNAVIISINSSEEVFVQGRKAEQSVLEQTIAEALKTEGTSLVVLEGDRRATLEKAIEIMDIAKQAGATKFAIAAEGK